MTTISSLSALFSDGAAIAPATFNTALYDPASGDSFEVINGRLDATNLATGFKVREKMVKRGALVRAHQVGSTTPLDFFRDLYPGSAPATLSARTHPQSRLDRFTPVPGGCIDVYVPAGAAALLWTWNIYFENDVIASGSVGYDAPDASPCVLKLDGSVVARRVSPSSVQATGNSRQSVFAQYWAGHYLELDPASGWRQASLWIAGSHKQVRVRTRAMRYVILR